MQVGEAAAQVADSDALAKRCPRTRPVVLDAQVEPALRHRSFDPHTAGFTGREQPVLERILEQRLEQQ